MEDLSELIGNSKHLDHAELVSMGKDWNKAKGITGDAGLFQSLKGSFLPETAAIGAGSIDAIGKGAKGLYPMQRGTQPIMTENLVGDN